MTEVRNLDKKLVCYIDKKNGIIEIGLKDCKTKISVLPNGQLEVINTKNH